MQGAPHRQARSSARSVFLLPLMLALLALVAFPVFAHAAGIPQYEVSPEETGITREPVHHPKSNEGQSPGSESQKAAHGSAANGANGPEGPGEEGESSHGGAAGKGESGGQGPSAGEPGKSGDGGAKSGGSGTENGVGPGLEAAGGGNVTPASSNSTSGGGSSSPIVPILIAVAVLAAISIGVVIYRQRKSGPGQDGRVSSSNAS
jgi:cobalamin biosynthesis Mg chelatase CobN